MQSTQQNQGVESNEEHAAELAGAVEQLRAGDIEEAHRVLVRLIRLYNRDPRVIFQLALARRRLGYDVSAEALFIRAFEAGYEFADDDTPRPLADTPQHYTWSDPSGSIHLELRRRPRRRTYELVTLDGKPPASGVRVNPNP